MNIVFQYERDAQRQKSYDCELAAIQNCYGNIDKSVVFSCVTYKTGEKFFQKIITSRWWKNRQPDNISPTLLLNPRMKLGGNAECERRVIQISPHSFSKYVIIHELAHVLTTYQNEKTNKRIFPPPHGPKFRKNLLILVKKYLPNKLYISLKKEFDQNNLDY